MKTITNRLVAEISIDGQNAIATAHVRLGVHKVMLSVRSNAYREQCHAVARVWVPAALKWNHVFDIPPSNMKTPKGVCYMAHSDIKQAVFQADLDTLRDGAAAIVLDD